jgi:hypothetical protein
MATGGIPEVRRPSKKEIRELLKLAWVADDALSTRNSQARVLPDGRVLLYVQDDGSGMLYPSRAAAEEMKRDYDETERKTIEQFRTGFHDPCRTLLPPVADFLRDVEAHAKSLGPRIGVADAVLDFTPASLDAVDKALKKIPWAKRQVPDLVTPLVAYVGEVMRKASGGRWTKAPTTRKRRVEVFDPAEMDAWWPAAVLAEKAAAEKAGAEARARRASKRDVASAIQAAQIAAASEMDKTRPKPIRFDVIDEPITGHENEPFVIGRDGRSCQPYAVVFLPMVEPSRRIPLRSAVDIQLRVGPPPAAA